MDVTNKEIQGSYKWLLIAGTAAIALSATLFYVDNVVMENAPKRDREHAAHMRELRIAQSSLAAGVTDSRQTLPLDIESDNSSATSKNGNPVETNVHKETGDHDSHAH